MRSRDRIRYMDALREALTGEMERDSSVIVVGEDVRSSIRGETKGLLDRFGPGRVLDTPISEASFVGFASGAALEGFRPVVEFQVSSLVYVAFDQLVNQAAKYSLMLGGQVSLPVTYLLMASGAARSNAGQHSDSPYALLAHMGMKVVCPATPEDAKGLLTAAIRDPDPVAVNVPARCLGLRGPVPESGYETSLGVGRTHRDGTDVTIIATGALVSSALAAADLLEERGHSARVWDPRSVLPLDVDGLVEAVAATGLVVVADDSNRFCGFASEIAAQIAQHAWETLKGPVVRLTRPTMPLPFNPELEDELLISTDDIAFAAGSLIEKTVSNRAKGANA